MSSPAAGPALLDDRRIRVLISLSFVILIILLILGVPVLYCFSAMIIILASFHGYTPLGLFPTLFGKLSSVVLLAIPLFIMAGGVMGRGRIGDALVDLIQVFLGRVKGSLAVVSVVACGVFGSICGSGAATLSCIGSIMLPKMRGKAYPMENIINKKCGYYKNNINF